MPKDEDVLRNIQLHRMPQLDRFVLFPQVFWFIIVFGAFFFLCSFFILPKIATSLVYRNVKLLSLSTSKFTVDSFLDHLPNLSYHIDLKTLANDLMVVENKRHEQMLLDVIHSVAFIVAEFGVQTSMLSSKTFLNKEFFILLFLKKNI